MKERILKSLSLVILATSLVICADGQGTEPKSKAQTTHYSIFTFHTDEFWLNLHHFLYVLGRAENKERDATREAVVNAPADQERGLKTLSVNEQTIWRQAVTAYAAGPSKKDIVFDDPLPGVTRALVGAGDAKSLNGVTVDSAIAAILEKVGPLYRKVWWR